MSRTVDAMAALGDLRIGAKVAGRLAACLLAQGKLEEQSHSWPTSVECFARRASAVVWQAV